MFTLAFFVFQLGHFQLYYLSRRKEYQRASVFIQSENCKNPLLRAQLGSFNLCDQSERVLGRYPFVSAIHDVAEDLHICGHSRCEIFYMDITSNLHKIVLGMVFLSLIGLWIFKKTMSDARSKREYEYYSLPTKNKAD